jgi:hypothetical protein
MKKTYTEAELNQLVSQLEVQFHSHLAKAEADAATANDLSKKEMDKCGEMSMAKDEDENKEDAEKKDEDKKEEEKKDEPQQAMELEKAEPTYSDSDKQELESLYKNMSKSEQEIHLEALKKAAGGEAQAEQPMQKTEEQPQGEEKLAKAEEQIAALQKSNEELTKTVGELVATLNKRISKPAAPKGKAVTQLVALEKSEKTEEKPAISREEAKKILSKKAQSETLAKSDREVINAFCFGQVGLDKVEHLLK